VCLEGAGDREVEAPAPAEDCDLERLAGGRGHGAVEAQVAAGIAADIERDLQRRITILQTLATSATLVNGDFAAFHARAQIVARDVKVGIFLIDPSMRQLLNTNVPFGTSLPDYGTPETALRTIQTRAPQLSEFFIGRVIQRPEDLDIDPRQATRNLLAARSMRDLVDASGGLYRPPGRFRNW